MENSTIYQGLKDTIAIINNALNGVIPSEIKSYSIAYKIAKNNGVQSLFSLGLKGIESVDSEIKTLADKTFNTEALQLSKQEYYAEEIFSSLKEKGVKFMPLKGYLLREFYPKKEMRNSCDIDFYFEKEKKAEVLNVIKNLGFTFSHKGPTHFVWKLDTVTIEPHFELFSNKDKIFKDYIATEFDGFVLKEKSMYAFSQEDYYLYMLYHAYKHMMESALSIRTIVDFYVFDKNVNYDKDYVNTRLEKLGLKTFNDKIKKLYGVWFMGESEDDEIKALSIFIAKNSLFGNSNNLFIMHNDLKSQDENNSKKVYLKRIFPPYYELKEKYRWVKSPLLYPLGWLVRVFALIFKRPKNIRKNIKTIKNIDKDSVKEIENVRKILNI